MWERDSPDPFPLGSAPIFLGSMNPKQQRPKQSLSTTTNPSSDSNRVGLTMPIPLLLRLTRAAIMFFLRSDSNGVGLTILLLRLTRPVIMVFRSSDSNRVGLVTMLILMLLRQTRPAIMFPRSSDSYRVGPTKLSRVLVLLLLGYSLNLEQVAVVGRVVFFFARTELR
ncbi:LOW QUALITY PROTEIN: hypothetical protein PanWU01x14_281150 [Parasponia andersonii]|uniref:Uncharacterized protein n=1 Tax=Parasponia andersonii TaxID=3476 RepID=A0A2P5B170_PARAD|nr:LOW QUALITY PROTEIN: hypothetical protein PanWU01x14_281150 [Parasponia andersonii]